MNWFLEYLASKKLALMVYGACGNGANEFYTVMMTAIRLAGSDELGRIRQAFPGLVENFQARYQAPGGAITSVEKEILDRMITAMQKEDE